MQSGPAFLQLRRVPVGVAGEAVRESWLVQAERCRTAVERALADPGIEVYFNLGPAGRRIFDPQEHGRLSPRAAWVIGPHAGSLFIEKEFADCDMVGVRLHPGVCRQVFGVPGTELRDTLVDLDALWGPVVESIRDRLRASPNAAARLEIVEKAVAARFERGGALAETRLVRRLCSAIGDARHPSIADAAAAYGLTHRRVIALFDEHVGLKPKAFNRVARLRRALALVHAQPNPSWTRIAHVCGYFDQSHLINDFRSLAGLAPREYAATRSSIGRGFAPFRLAWQQPCAR